MASVECSVRLLPSSSKSWNLLLRIDQERFKSLESTKSYLEDRLRERVTDEGIKDFSLHIHLVRKRESQEMYYDIHGEIDWAEYLPLLVENHDIFSLCVDIFELEKPLLSPSVKDSKGQEVKKKQFGIKVNMAKSP